MAAVQLPVASSVSTGSSNCISFVSHDLKSKEFPIGLRVLVVDDDVTCLMILRQMLEKCLYEVTTCCQATIALSLLRERKGCFDVVISDVHMPDMDGFKLLEHVGLEMGLPVIMMSADARTDIVMRGIDHGACNYLIKPIRLEELKNIWQHVVRKNSIRHKEAEHSSSLEDFDCLSQVPDDAKNASSVNDGVDGTWRSHKKKRDAKEDEDRGELEGDDPSLGKKPRVVWSVELHQQFVHAVNQLGIDKAVPKRILELMNVPGLTRENVASHLQKFRLYLKKMNKISQQQAGNYNSYPLPGELNVEACSLGGLNFQPVAASVQIPTQTLASFNAELLGQPTVVLPSIDQPVHLRGSVQEGNCDPFDQGVSFGQPLLKCQTSSKQLSQSNIAVEHIPSTFSASPPNYLSRMGSFETLGGVTGLQNGNIQMHMLHQQQSRPLSDLHQESNVQPSLWLVPTQASNSLQIEDNTTLINQNSITVPPLSSSDLVIGNDSIYFHQSPDPGNMFMENRLIASQTDNASLDGGQVSDGELNSLGLLNRFPISRPFSSIMASCTARSGSSGWRAQTPPASTCSTTRLPVISNADSMQGSGIRSVALPKQGQEQRLVNYGKDATIANRFAVDDLESHNYLGHWKTCDDDGVNQDSHLDFIHSVEYSCSAHFMK